MTPRPCPSCGKRVASMTCGPLMQVRCIGDDWPFNDTGCSATWRPSEFNSVAWANFDADLRHPKLLRRLAAPWRPLAK